MTISNALRFLATNTTNGRMLISITGPRCTCAMMSTRTASYEQFQQQPPRLKSWGTAPTTYETAAGRDWRKPPQQQKNKQELRRLKPQRFNSIVYFPKTVHLQYPDKNPDTTTQNPFELQCVDFAISQPGKGGHVVLGRNGCGKSLLVKYLSQQELLDEQRKQGEQANEWKLLDSSDVAFVSFESHLQTLQDNPHLTVHDSITGGAGNLSKAAQYLVVRFGLFPLLHRTVSTLSTGEIRKCLLVSALSQEPRLLVLENAFDGLDVSSRQELKSIVSKTIKGLGSSGKLLVTHVNAEYVPPAQVFMSTHRPEEIVDEISTVSLVVRSEEKGNHVVTIRRPPGWSQEQLMYMSLGLDKDHNKNKNWTALAPWQDEDPTLPSLEDIQAVWKEDQDSKTPEKIISLDHVEIRRRRDGDTNKEKDDSEFATLLHELSWDIEKGQRWLIAGPNGAGKSTLSRFLLQREDGNGSNATAAVDDKDTTCDLTSGIYSKDKHTTIGWVSTESHVGTVVNKNGTGTGDGEGAPTAWDVISHGGSISESITAKMVQWVFGGGDSSKFRQILKNCPLEELSQGQQKLALIASALALRPNIIILDEPTQGLDWVNRRRVLALFERLCQANAEDLSLIYITHYREEWIPSIDHVLHLDGGRVLYQGPKKEYIQDYLGENE